MKNKLLEHFHSNVESIAETLIKRFQLEHKKKIKELSSPLLRWIDFSSRFVEPKSRSVILSEKLKQRLGGELAVAEKAFKYFISQSELGLDLNPFQSKSLIKFNDISGKKKLKRTDLLWADWGIHHFHVILSDDTNEYFSTRSDWLLFAYIINNIIYAIDIRPHKENSVFAQIELLETIHDNWPQLLKSSELGGILPGENNFTPQEIDELRRAGVVSCISIKDKVYAPLGFGLTTAATPVIVNDLAGRIYHGIESIIDYILDSDSSFQNLGKEKPFYSLVITPRGLSVHDKNNDIAYLLPRDGNCALCHLQNLLLPNWSMAKI
ncbi:hypothetical protein [Psychromonas sp. Urea-02u-13]|uniref:hypothetical protein n=1 Tax=Psychromonas sp. Urea-02u-13 TaxID=2058326 RepID=UPI000C321EFE|nr:hypothetical protein [Psychromonas sp. Urea-02u-13]PKG37042.1 hypothetical protein CXF74_20975 [Psychromonas sp. Urea-02u-13]